MAAMTPEQRDAFLARPLIAKLATLNADGSPNVVPVWFEWWGGQALVFTSRGSPKVRRLARDNRVALSVEEPAGVNEAWVTIEGVAAIDGEGTWELIQRLTPRYYEPARAAKALNDWATMKAEWVTIRITPRRILSMAPE
jgi:PPOX class probable F420-dependent enzyme